MTRLPFWARDRQGRARRTRAAILAAAQELVSIRPVQDIAVQDLARSAGISIGALYARFPSREAVLALLGFLTYLEIESIFAWALGEGLGEAPGPDEVVRAYVSTRVLTTRRHAPVLRALRQMGSSLDLPDEVGLVEEAIRQRLRDRLGPLRWERGAEDAGARLDLALIVADAAVAEAILARGAHAPGLPPDDGFLVRELSQVLAGYLGPLTQPPA